MATKKQKPENENYVTVNEILAETRDFYEFSNIIKTQIGEASEEVIQVIYHLIHSTNGN